jgi:hypothetical protein
MKKKQLSILELDKLGVRAFVGYSTLTGYFSVEIYRDKLDHEKANRGDWRPIRHKHPNTFRTRKKAQSVALEMGNSIYNDFFVPQEIKGGNS